MTLHPSQHAVHGSTISLMQPGILPGIGIPTPWGWAKHRITTVTSGQVKMRGKRSLRVTVSSHIVDHQFWVANIQGLCIVGLDLLTKWGVVVDVRRTTLYIGSQAIPLHTYGEAGFCTSSTVPAESSRLTELEVSPTLLQPGLSRPSLLAVESTALADILAARDEDCTHTNLVLHDINTEEEHSNTPASPSQPPC